MPKKNQEKRDSNLRPVGAEFDEDIEFDDEEIAPPTFDIAYGYDETDWEKTCVRCCGGCCLVFLAMLVFSWVVHSIPVATVTDVPPFAKSLLWLSIAHHTDSWKELQASVSPPPPAFGDGLGNFVDT